MEDPGSRHLRPRISPKALQFARRRGLDLAQVHVGDRPIRLRDVRSSSTRRLREGPGQPPEGEPGAGSSQRHHVGLRLIMGSGEEGARRGQGGEDPWRGCTTQVLRLVQAIASALRGDGAPENASRSRLRGESEVIRIVVQTPSGVSDRTLALAELANAVSGRKVLEHALTEAGLALAEGVPRATVHLVGSGTEAHLVARCETSAGLAIYCGPPQVEPIAVMTQSGEPGISLATVLPVEATWIGNGEVSQHQVSLLNRMHEDFRLATSSGHAGSVLV